MTTAWPEPSHDEDPDVHGESEADDGTPGAVQDDDGAA